MARIQKKRRWEAILSSPILLMVLVCFLGFLGVSVYERYTVERDMAARLYETQQTKAELEARKAQLQERVERLQGERGIETEIRQNFDVTREGEQVVIILDDEPEELLPTPEPVVTPKPWYQFW